ncbi:PBS lyase HEAT-like repeat [Sesbania bispinosa]|nr:PBS lyase HEAT-like repeat [Sesbania bispinosa]
MEKLPPSCPRRPVPVSCSLFFVRLSAACRSSFQQQTRLPSALCPRGRSSVVVVVRSPISGGLFFYASLRRVREQPRPPVALRPEAGASSFAHLGLVSSSSIAGQRPSCSPLQKVEEWGHQSITLSRSLAMDSSNDVALGSSEMEKFLCELLLDSTQPISERFRALFSLRNLKGPAPRNALILATRDSSNLLAHEAAFALGQMQDLEAIPALTSVLNDLSLHPIVRHEAAEALGAIGSDSNIPLLKNSLDSDPAPEVRETCELALHRIQHLKDAGNTDESTTDISPFKSVDPAAPATSCSSVDQLREVLLDEEKGMYERYAALFALRNDGGDKAVAAIIDSLGSKSALLRHEVAYVLGQLQNKSASTTLSNVLKDVNEHPMVRHEAAEALGSIADDESVALLEEFTADPEPLVSQSCQVALSMLEFERSGKSFEFLFMRTPIKETCSSCTFEEVYLKFPQESKVFELFSYMTNYCAFQWDAFTMEGLVLVCVNVLAGGGGKAFHGVWIEEANDNNDVVLWSDVIRLCQKKVNFGSLVQVQKDA